MDIFKPQSKNKNARMFFCIFELAAFAYFFVTFILGIINATQIGDFGLFVESFFGALMTSLIVWGIGKIIDCLCVREENNKNE